jgi:hypothetical protein
MKERSQKLAEMMQLEDAMHVLKMTTSTRTRGRKPSGYMSLTTIKDVVMFALDKELNKSKPLGTGAFTMK